MGLGSWSQLRCSFGGIPPPPINSASALDGPRGAGPSYLGGGRRTIHMGVRVIGLGAWAELAHKDDRGMDIDVHEFAVLNDGRRLTLHQIAVSARARRT